MGREAVCWATFDGERAEGKAHLDTDALTFRGGFRLTIPYGEVRGAESEDGRLRVVFSGGEAVFELGTQAGAWEERILNPPSLMQKLGVKAGMRAGILGPVDSEFLDALSRSGVEMSGDSEGLEVVFVQVEEPGELSRLAETRGMIRSDGMVWVISPKGRKDLRDIEVMAAGKAAGLVDVKVARFSESHTALKFVVPKAERRVRDY